MATEDKTMAGDIEITDEAIEAGARTLARDHAFSKLTDLGGIDAYVEKTWRRYKAEATLVITACAPYIAKAAQAEAREAAAPTYDLVVAAQMVLAKYLEPVDDPFPGSETALAALIRLFDGPEQRMAQAAFTPSGEPTCPGGPCKTYGTPESKCEWPSCAIRSMEVE